MDDLSRIRELITQNRVNDAIQALVEFCQSNRKSVGHHGETARMAEEMGLSGLAIREYNLTVRDTPGDAQALQALADLYMEQGAVQKAKNMLERAIRVPSFDALRTLVDIYRAEGMEVAVKTAVRAAVDAGLDAKKAGALAGSASANNDIVYIDGIADDRPPELPADADIIRFLHLFSGRENRYARQWYSPTKGRGGYSPVDGPLTPRILRRHFMGDQTLGVYLLRLDNTATFFAFDIDLNRDAIQGAASADISKLRRNLRKTAKLVMDMLDAMKIPFVLESSGYKGFHVWVFLEEPLPAEVLWNLGRLLMGKIGSAVPLGCHVEFFPKQPARSKKGYGNLIKLPLGVHLVSGRRSRFVDQDFNGIDRPFDALREACFAGRDQIFSVIQSMKDRITSTEHATPRAFNETPVRNEQKIYEVPGPEPLPYWTEADFDTDPEVSWLLNKCPVLGLLKRQADEQGRLSYDEAMVITHTMGHLRKGVLVVNYIFSRCANLGTEHMLKSRLKGYPMSCPKIRHRIPSITSQVVCNCDFSDANHYPTPNLHLRTMPESAPGHKESANDSVQDLARRYLRQMALLDRAAQDLNILRNDLIHALNNTSDRAIVLEDGTLRAMTTDGITEIKWEPAENGKDTDNH